MESELAWRDAAPPLAFPLPPPVPPTHIKNHYAWILASVPLFGALIQSTANLENNFGQHYQLYLLGIYFLLNSILVSLDVKRIKQSGRDPDQLGAWFWFVPIYLFKRYRVLKQRSGYFWASLACLVATMTVPSTNGAPGILTALLSLPSCSDELITQKVKEIAGQMPLAIHLNIAVTEIVNVSEVRQFEQRRYCRATLRTSIGTQSNVIYYLEGRGFGFYVHVEPTL